MARVIRIDDEVYDTLQQRARSFVDTPNSVIRAALGLPDMAKHSLGDDAVIAADADGAAAAAGGRSLVALLDAGWLLADDPLSWSRRNAGVAISAAVTAEGLIELESRELFASPTAAASAVAGHKQNGWTVWRTRTGDTLDELWARSRATPIPNGVPLLRLVTRHEYGMAWEDGHGNLIIVDACGAWFTGALFRVTDRTRRARLELDGLITRSTRDDYSFRITAPLPPMSRRDATALLLGDDPGTVDQDNFADRSAESIDAAPERVPRWMRYTTSSTSMTSPVEVKVTISSSSEASGSIE